MYRSAGKNKFIRPTMKESDIQRIGTTNTSFFEQRNASMMNSLKSRVQSQKAPKRMKHLYQALRPRENMLIQNMKNNPKLRQTGVDWKSSTNLTDELLSQNHNESFREIQPRRVIPLNLMNVGNIRGQSLGDNAQGGCSTNISRFQDAYCSPYSQKRFNQDEKQVQYFHLRNRTKFGNRMHIFRSPRRLNQSRGSNGGNSAYYDNRLSNQSAAINTLREETAENADSEAAKPADEKQYIYILPDGIDILKDKYKIYKQDIKPYIDSMLPDKDEIEKKYPYLSKKEKIKMLLPSEQIREQVYQQFLADVTQDMRSREDYVALFDIHGHKITDLMDINENTKVFIVSAKEECKGITGIEAIDTEDYKQDDSRQKTKQAFLQA
jgi:hypothetical protein